jgi:succinate-acetate transporter protein
LENQSATANPAPLGLMGFGTTTVLLNLHNTGIYPDINSAILAMGIFYGGIAQIIAGILEFRKGNTFGLTAFTSYGSFWLTLVLLICGPKMAPAVFAPTSPAFFGWFLVVWGVFTLFMTFGTLKGPKALQFVFVSLTILFGLLAWHKFTESALIGHIAGWEGIVCGASAIYLAMAEVLNEKFGRTVLPVG